MGKIRVNITASQRVDYNQVILMEESDYELIMHLIGDEVDSSDPETKQAYRILEKNLNFEDIYYAESTLSDVTVSKTKIQ